jgi:Fe-S oxidoreductase
MMRVSHSEAVFWPGCALMTLDPSILRAALAVLRRAEPALGIASLCCGQPTRYLFPKLYVHRCQRVAALLAKNGVRRVYTACPNCFAQLSEQDVEVLPIWEALRACLRPEDLHPSCGAAYALHDPCPTRAQPAQQDAVRALLQAAGVAVLEPAHSGAHTRCCGNYHMLHTLDPAQSAQLREERCAEFPEGHAILSYCEGCLGAFRGEGRQTAHVLEVLFGASKRRGWRNRIAFTLGKGR